MKIYETPYFEKIKYTDDVLTISDNVEVDDLGDMEDIDD